MKARPIKPVKGMPERWKQYKDTNYWVSDQGRVKHKYKNGNEHECGWVDKKHTNNQMVCKIKGKNIKVSKLVYETWVGKLPKGTGLVHKNGLKKDNSIYNLKPLSFEEMGKKYGYKPKCHKVYNKENNMIYRSARAVERCLPISRQTVTDICNGKVKKPLMDLYWYNENNDTYYRGRYKVDRTI